MTASLRSLFRVIGVMVAAGGLVLCSFPARAEGVLTGAAAYTDWRADAPGVRRKITVDSLPPPLATPVVAARSEVVGRPQGVMLKVPPHFRAEVYATGLESPRVLRVAPNGDVFVTESSAGRIRALRADKTGHAAVESSIFASGLERPSGIEFFPPDSNPRYLYVSTPTQILRYPYRDGDLTASDNPQIVVDDLPAGGHWTRDLAFSPDGETLFVAVGSKSNVAEAVSLEEDAELSDETRIIGAAGGPERDRADVLAFDPDGRNKRIFASGLRNCSGLTIRASPRELWCVVNERDMLGDNLPPDYATSVKAGAFYGWPWYYIGGKSDPRHAGKHPELANKVTTPDVLIQAHSGPLGITFYEGAQFPAEYRGDAFVALHGSWNRAQRTGYKIIRLKFSDGIPTGEYEDFLVGFVVDDTRVWGRPVDVAVAPDGSLLMSEDANGTLWRISYEPE